jgi:hypothetical protein
MMTSEGFTRAAMSLTESAAELVPAGAGTGLLTAGWAALARFISNVPGLSWAEAIVAKRMAAMKPISRPLRKKVAEDASASWSAAVLCRFCPRWKSARGLAQSKTWRFRVASWGKPRVGLQFGEEDSELTRGTFVGWSG